MENRLAKEYEILDKSWHIRMGVLDILNKRDDTIGFLINHNHICEDLKSLHQASLDWKSNKPVYVGESGTLYRFLKFASWKLNLNKKFIKHRTLKNRDICDNPEIVDWSLKELLKLDNGTSQWASASVLLGNNEKIEKPPFKLHITYEAVEHWNNLRKKGKIWVPRYDETIKTQALSFLDLLKKGKTDFQPLQAEDYCFARAFNLISKEEGEKRWSSLKNHESNRIEAMEEAIKAHKAGNIIQSDDHRVVMALAKYIKFKNRNLDIKTIKSMFSNPLAVNKSFPKFWQFMEDFSKLR